MFFSKTKKNSSNNLKKEEQNNDTLQDVFCKFIKLSLKKVKNQYALSYYNDDYSPAFVCFSNIYFNEKNELQLKDLTLICLKNNEAALFANNENLHWCPIREYCCEKNCFAHIMLYKIKAQILNYLNELWNIFKTKSFSITNDESPKFEPIFSNMGDYCWYEFEKNKIKSIYFENPFFDSICFFPTEYEMKKLVICSRLKSCKLTSKRTGKDFVADIVIKDWKSKTSDDTEFFSPVFELKF